MTTQNQKQKKLSKSLKAKHTALREKRQELEEGLAMRLQQLKKDRLIDQEELKESLNQKIEKNSVLLKNYRHNQSQFQKQRNELKNLKV